jgi:hypothetical protein
MKECDICEKKATFTSSNWNACKDHEDEYDAKWAINKGEANRWFAEQSNNKSKKLSEKKNKCRLCDSNKRHHSSIFCNAHGHEWDRRCMPYRKVDKFIAEKLAEKKIDKVSFQGNTVGSLSELYNTGHYDKEYDPSPSIIGDNDNSTTKSEGIASCDHIWKTDMVGIWGDRYESCSKCSIKKEVYEQRKTED